MRNQILRFITFVLIYLLMNVVVISCGDKNSNLTVNKLKIVTTLFPLYDFTKNITGAKADISIILPPGVEPHSFEPRASDILKINSADIFIYTGRFMEPWAEDIIKGVDNKGLLVLDLSIGVNLLTHKPDEHRHREGYRHNRHDEQAGIDVDPHIWLDLSNAQLMVDNILAGLIKKDPANRDYYEKNAQAYKAKIGELDERYKTTLASCKKRVIVHGGHFAFGYLARRYNLSYLSAYTGSPNSEPTPRHVAYLKKIIEDNNIKYVYFEELIMPRVADLLARETGAKILMLHGCHNITKDEMERGVSFISLMEGNLKNLSVGLECQ
ncbi:MAG: zinc ABC transporter substrate-binding protein [Syntrophorhabdaceae bacterium]|nr:zinc ABC transporter substrate-binding protein [Syntrophorhabdaceae bacterium]